MKSFFLFKRAFEQEMGVVVSFAIEYIYRIEAPSRGGITQTNKTTTLISKTHNIRETKFQLSLLLPQFGYCKSYLAPVLPYVVQCDISVREIESALSLPLQRLALLKQFFFYLLIDRFS